MQIPKNLRVRIAAASLAASAASLSFPSAALAHERSPQGSVHACISAAIGDNGRLDGSVLAECINDWVRQRAGNAGAIGTSTSRGAKTIAVNNSILGAAVSSGANDQTDGGGASAVNSAILGSAVAIDGDDEGGSAVAINTGILGSARAS